MGRRPQKGIKKGGKFKPGDGPGVLVHANYHAELDGGFSDNPGYEVRNATNGKRDGGYVDDIYQDQDNQSGDTRSNSVSQSARLDRDASAMISVQDYPYYDQNGYENESISPVDRALYDPDLDANWMELTVSTCVLFPQRDPKRTYIYQYTLRIWDCNKTSEAAATGQLGQLLFDQE